MTTTVELILAAVYVAGIVPTYLVARTVFWLGPDEDGVMMKVACGLIATASILLLWILLLIRHAEKSAGRRP